MFPVTMPWRASSAYLYILQLDGPALAWEYLRRNPDYRYQWQSGELEAHSEFVTQWGCRVAEDPSLDARFARPAWVEEPCETVRITALEHASGQEFELWKVESPRDLTHVGIHLELQFSRSRSPLRVHLDDSIEVGKPFAYVIRADKLLRARIASACRFSDALTRRRKAKNAPKTIPSNRRRLTHARTLQALDGEAAGASHREIAAAIFGADDVARRWSPDSELRAQVRYLLRRGRGFVNGQYRALLAGKER